jgi:uncharacterized protein involved in exopolysaccharide biosynthesis
MLHSIETTYQNLKRILAKPALLSLLSAIIVALYTLTMPDYYRSEARLLPVETKGGAGNLGGLANAAAALGVMVPGGDGGDANYVDILNSRVLREKLLLTDYEYRIRSWRFGEERVEKITLFNYLKSKNMDRAVRTVGAVLSCSRDPKSRIISISAVTRSPELSKLIVQRASKLLETFLQEKGRTRGGAKALFAEARLDEARRELDDSEESLRRFLEINRNYQISGDPAVRLRGMRLEAEYRLRQQLVTTIAMNREQALQEEKNDMPILNVLDSANLPIDKTKPNRGFIVIFSAFIVGVCSFIWFNGSRESLQRILLLLIPGDK